MNRTLRLLFVCLLQAVWAVASAYNLKVEATPHGACSFNTSGGDYDEGSRVYLRTYSNTGYVFKGWYKGDEVISSSASFYYTMPAADVVLQARYEYDPTVPADPAMPDTKYKLSLGITPNGAGSLNNSGGSYAEGTKVSLRAYVNTGFHFTGWTDEAGDTLSTSTSYSYTMPGRNVKLTANYYYDPSAPANPDSMATKYTVQVKCKPVGGGSFNTSSTTAPEGSSVRLYSYTNTGYIFKHWEDSEGKVLSTAQNFYYTIPHGNSVVYGVFEYDPPVPSNPGKNYWNKELGEVIVDDFSAGYLGNAVSSVIGGSSRDEVAMITVAGKMNDNDFGIANNFTNCTLLDLSRVTGITTVPSYAFDYTNLESVYLPASIETIGYKAFYECKQLSSLTVYAMVPPAVEDYAFSGIPEGLVVYVPAASISQYQEAEGWKNFTLLPIQEDIRNVTISLPEGTDASVYAQMWLELTNRKSGQRMHFVMTDRSSYTFANIIRNTSWNAVIRNQRGDVFGKIDAIDVADEDVTVAFESLQQPQNVTLTVKDAEGKDVTADTQITWTDAAGNYLAQAFSVNGLLPGNKLGYNIVLSQNLAMAYSAPSLTEYTVADNGNSIVCTLSPLQKVVVTGKVIDLTTKSAISGAIVSASQTFGGKYSKTTNVKTDAKGQYSIEIFRVPTSLAIAASDYISQTVECDVINAEGEAVSVADVSLKSITGAVISLGFTYTKTPDNEGEDGSVESYYSDYNNVDYAIFNKTQNRSIGQYNVQYPQIVLLEEVNENDVLELTASSRTSAFVPVKTTATIDAEQRASATFNIVGLGKLKSTFEVNGNVSVVGSLYDAKGKLIKTYDYSGGSLTISDLADGNYTLVTMGSSRLFNTIYDLSQLPQTGFTKDADYVQNSVNVESGKLSVISIAEVPTLDESKLYYTGDNTSFTVNKSSIVAGNYLTLTGHLDFKSAYSTKVSNVNLIVDLPESCSFVENSVMVGNSTSSYTLNGNRLTIPMSRYTDRVRFCVIPTLSGDYAPSALAQFDIEGKTITQPIGSANYTAKDLSISVPSTVAKTTIPVSGTAIGASDIEIYDGDVLIGQTKSLAGGSWSATVELDNPYNLSVHNIYAKVITKAGLSLKSETQSCTYRQNDIYAKTVEMTFYNGWMKKNISVTFDLENQTCDASSYSFYHETDFTFAANLSNNDTTIVKGVTIGVYTNRDGWIDIEATYNAKMDRWVSVHKFGSNNLPTGVKVDIDADYIIYGDRKFLNNVISSVEQNFDTDKSIITDIVQEFQSVDENEESDYRITAIDSLLLQDNCDYSLLNSLIMDVVGNDTLSNCVGGIDLTYEIMKAEYDEWIINFKNGEADSLLLDLNIPISAINIPVLSDNFEFTKYGELGSYTVKSSILEFVNEDDLLQKGYDSLDMTDGSRIFYLFRSDSTIFVDVQRHIKYELYNDSLNSSNTRKAKSWNGVSNDFVESANSYTSCLNALMVAIQKLNNGNSNDNRAWKTYSEGFIAVKDAAECFYEHALSYILSKLKSAYTAKTGELNTKIDVRNQKLAEYKSALYQANKDYQSLEVRQVIITNELANTNDAEKIARLKTEYQMNSVLIESGKKDAAKFISYIDETEKEIKRLTKTRNVLTKAYDFAKGPFEKLPRFLTKHPKLGKATQVAGKLVGGFGVLLEVISLYDDVINAIDDMASWSNLSNAIDSKIPCENNESKALDLQNRIENDASSLFWNYVRILYSEYSAIKIDAASLAAIECPPVELAMWLISGALNGYAECSKFFSIDNKYLTKQVKYWMEVSELKCEDDKCPKCHKEPCECNKPCPTCKHKPCICCVYCNHYPCICTHCSKCGKRVQFCTCKKCKKCGKVDCVCKPNPEVKGILDPSGYVYEGVASNRLEGVTATCYYKENVEDMYGDKHENIVKWDAAEYAQENPLFTDENGYYRWDVPQGLWQVKFEKEGYETTYSEWLPVPPPQLDINIAMKQNVQPNVKTARAFEDAVEMEFDKYMMPELLTSDNIRVMAGETAVEGTVELLNEEVSYEGNEEKFASKVRFNAAAPFDATEVTLMVSNRVKSYAGIRMQDDFSQTFTIEPEVQKIVCDAEASIEYGGQGELTVQVLPAVASAGKTLKVKSSSAMILSTDVEELTLDNEGKASLKVGGELPGAAAITYSVDGYDLSATTMVNVEQVQLVPDKPLASIASGSALLKGTQITLSCPTSSAEIYYTTDGSCPCEAGAKKYDGTPITISEGTTLKIMAVGKNGDESEIVTYTYTLRQTNLNVPLAKGWNWVSHNQDVALTSDKLEMDNVDRVLTQIGELYRDPKIGFTGHIDDVNATDAFKVHTTDAGNMQLGGVMYNPYFSPVELKRGWNWLGYPLEKTMTVDDAFSLMESEANDYIVNLEGGFAQFNGDNWIGTLETLTPGQGYLFKSASDKELAYNIFAAAAPSANAASVIPSDDMPWQYDSHAYPNVMCVTADLYVKDVKAVAGEYLVGAFVDGECRGVGRYVDNTLFLSVHGDKNVEMTLLAMDNESGVVYDITERLMFTPDVVGSVSMPYPLHVGSPTGISNITMGNSDFKSIHNVLGQKVKSIDRGGVFIIDGRKRVVTKRNEQEYLK